MSLPIFLVIEVLPCVLEMVLMRGSKRKGLSPSELWRTSTEVSVEGTKLCRNDTSWIRPVSRVVALIFWWSQVHQEAHNFAEFLLKLKVWYCIPDKCFHWPPVNLNKHYHWLTVKAVDLNRHCNRPPVDLIHLNRHYAWPPVYLIHLMDTISDFL